MSGRSLQTARRSTAFLRGVLHPEAFHGAHARAPFFEGWYLKLVTRDGRYLAVVPGLFRHTPETSHAFIQVVDGARETPVYERFPLSDFHGADERFDVRIGDNRFHLDGMSLALASLAGTVRFGKTEGWPVRLQAPGAMGWFAWLPFMHTYHGILGFDHELSGTLTIAGEPVSFDGGKGYIEKDWGQRFPNAWIWLQCNHFDDRGTSLALSVGRVPWGRGGFAGFIAAIRHAGELVYFTTWSGAKWRKLYADRERAGLRFADASHTLEINAECGEIARRVIGPSRQGMDVTIAEHVAAHVKVRLAARAGDRTLFEGESHAAGLEIEGPLEQLEPGTGPLSGWWRRS